MLVVDLRRKKPHKIIKCLHTYSSESSKKKSYNKQNNNSMREYNEALSFQLPYSFDENKNKHQTVANGQWYMTIYDYLELKWTYVDDSIMSKYWNDSSVYIHNQQKKKQQQLYSIWLVYGIFVIFFLYLCYVNSTNDRDAKITNGKCRNIRQKTKLLAEYECNNLQLWIERCR